MKFYSYKLIDTKSTTVQQNPFGQYIHEQYTHTPFTHITFLSEYLKPFWYKQHKAPSIPLFPLYCQVFLLYLTLRRTFCHLSVPHNS